MGVTMRVIKELKCKITGTLARSTKFEALAYTIEATNMQSDKINELIKEVNRLTAKVKELEDAVNK